MNKIRIGNKKIGEGYPCFIVAEIGMNHNGDVELAKKIIKSAFSCGVDAVKFQIFTAERLVTKNAKTYGAVKDHLPRCQQEMYKKYELKEEEYKRLKKCCDEFGLNFFASVFDEENADMLERVGTCAYKIASCDITHIPLIEHIAKKGKPIILSTGMSTLGEVKEAVDAIISKGNKQIVLTHCISSYPAKIEGSNLKSINTLEKEFGFIVGYSDHTSGWLSDIAAVALGAKVIEKHFTIDKKLQGVDHHLSMNPKEMKELVKNVRIVEKGLGNGKKNATKAEIETRKLARRSIIARIDIPRGAVITKEMLVIKRPGTGITPKDIHKVIKKKAVRKIKQDEILSYGALE